MHLPKRTRRTSNIPSIPGGAISTATNSPPIGISVQSWQQFLARPALNYVLNEKTHLSAGYTYIQNYPPIKGTGTHVREHNIWEQVTLKGKSEEVKMSHRYRLEHRWIRTPVLKEGRKNGP